MAVKEFRSNVVTQYGFCQLFTGDATFTSAPIDTQGYGNGIIVVPTMASHVAGTVSLTIQEADDVSGPWTNVPSDNIDGSIPDKTAADVLSAVLPNAAIMFSKRYFRIEVTGTGGANCTYCVHYLKEGELKPVTLT